MVSQAEILERLGERFTLTPVRRAGQRPGRAVPRRRRPADGGRHRQRLGAVLRQLRPGAAHRRRPAAQLPVRPPRGRPARPDPGRRQRRGARRPGHRGDVGEEVRATASTRPASSSPTARCQRSVAESSGSHVGSSGPRVICGVSSTTGSTGRTRPADPRHHGVGRDHGDERQEHRTGREDPPVPRVDDHEQHEAGRADGHRDEVLLEPSGLVLGARLGRARHRLDVVVVTGRGHPSTVCRCGSGYPAVVH